MPGAFVVLLGLCSHTNEGCHWKCVLNEDVLRLRVFIMNTPDSCKPQTVSTMLSGFEPLDTASTGASLHQYSPIKGGVVMCIGPTSCFHNLEFGRSSSLTFLVKLNCGRSETGMANLVRFVVEPCVRLKLYILQGAGVYLARSTRNGHMVESLDGPWHSCCTTRSTCPRLRVMGSIILNVAKIADT